MRILFYIAVATALWWIWDVFFNKTPAPIPVASPVAGMSDAEQEYYRQIFDYTMSNTEAGQSYSWQSYGGSGAISVSKIFQSKSGSLCREFSERIMTGGRETTATGIACRREGKEGWCRLEKGQALTCALETPAHSIGIGGGGIHAPNVNVTVPALNTGNSQPATSQAGNPGANTIDPAQAKKPTGNDVANSVTGAAGNAAGKATGGAIEWFQRTFR